MSGTLTAKIVNGGALLADTRRFLEAWDPNLRPEANLLRIAEEGRLGKTQARHRAVLAILRRRFVNAGGKVITALRRLSHDPAAFRQACYYEAARTDGLLAAFAGGPLLMWYAEGRRQLDVDDVERWLVSDQRVPRWGLQTRKRVARGLLATLRDFGILDGTVRGRRKRIASPHLSMRAFLYVALREKSRRHSSRAILESPAWRWYLLTPAMVRSLFLEADRLGYLRFVQAGSIARIDWLVDNLEEMDNAAPL